MLNQDDLFPKSKRDLITKSEFARLMGVSAPAVSAAIKDGRIRVVAVAGRELIDPVESEASWKARTRFRSDGPVEHGVNGPKGIASESSGLIRDELRSARHRKESAQADIAEFERDQLRKTLVLRAAVVRSLTDASAIILAEFDGLPERLPAILDGLDQHGIREALRFEVAQVQQRIADALNSAGEIASTTTEEPT